jgi:membrane protein implicated in regulation of membrane protease activity
LKRVSNTYSARTVSGLNYGPTAAERYLWWLPGIPNYVWLAMIIMALFALSVSTLMRSWEQEREARASYIYTETRVGNARGVQRDIKERTGRIRNDPRVAARVAQDQLRLVRANEVVVAAP